MIVNVVLTFMVGVCVVLAGYALCTLVGAVTYCLLKKHNKLSLIYPNFLIGKSISTLGFWTIIALVTVLIAFWFIGKVTISAF